MTDPPSFAAAVDCFMTIQGRRSSQQAPCCTLSVAVFIQIYGFSEKCTEIIVNNINVINDHDSSISVTDRTFLGIRILYIQ